jgi:hypothetical protein
MKRSRITEEQIIGTPKEQEAGARTSDGCREHAISDATIQGEVWRQGRVGCPPTEGA